MMKEDIASVQLNRYEVNIDDMTDNVEVYARCIYDTYPNLRFMCGDQVIAEFKTWRYWIYKGCITVPGGWVYGGEN